VEFFRCLPHSKLRQAPKRRFGDATLQLILSEWVQSTHNASRDFERTTGITGARTYGYDAAGNTTGYSTVTATYNNAGRLQTLATGSTTETSIYNALGQRIQISGGPAGGILYAYDEAGQQTILKQTGYPFHMTAEQHQDAMKNGIKLSPDQPVTDDAGKIRIIVFERSTAYALLISKFHIRF